MSRPGRVVITIIIIGVFGAADFGSDRPQRTETVRGGRVPELLRQDQHGDDAVHVAGLQGGVRGRRHRLDAFRPGRAAEGHQPGVRVLRRGARHVQVYESGGHGHGVREHHIHQRGADQRRRRVLGGHGGPGAGSDRHRLAGRTVDPGHRETCGSSQFQVGASAIFSARFRGRKTTAVLFVGVSVRV